MPDSVAPNKRFEGTHQPRHGFLGRLGSVARLVRPST